MKITKRKGSRLTSSDEMIESSVMKKIYGIEKRKTTVIVTEYSLLITIFLVLGVSFALLVISLMNQAEVFDMFQLFTQDPGTIKQYFWDTMQTIYLETPKNYILLSSIFLTVACVLFLSFKKRLPIISQKLHSIKRFGKRYH